MSFHQQFKSTSLSDQLEEGLLGLNYFEDVNDVKEALNYIDSNGLKIIKNSTELLIIYSNNDGSKKVAIKYINDKPTEGAIYHKK